MKLILSLVLLLSTACKARAVDWNETPPPPKESGGVMCAAVMPRIEYTEGTKPGEPEDSMAQQSSIKRCGQLYPNSPCVKKIVKKRGPHYNVICTGPS